MSKLNALMIDFTTVRRILGQNRPFFIFGFLGALFMAQTKITVTGLTSKADGDKLVEQTSSVVGVRFVNANHEQGYVVVTHSEEFDEGAFKAAVTAAGFGA